MRYLLAFAAAAALAAAQAAAATAAPAPPAPASERVEGSALRRDAAIYVLPLLVVIALLIAILAGEEEPESP